MASRNSRLLQAGDLAIGAKNYADWVKERFEKSTTKRGQASVPSGKIESRPRTKVAVKPYGAEATGNGYKLVTASKKAVDEIAQSLGSRISQDDTTKGGADSSKGYSPARVTWFVPESQGAANAKYVKSSRTKLNYIKYNGTSFTAPHGAVADNEEYLEGLAKVKAAILAKYKTKDNIRISAKNESF